ncbi:hypothetical protein GA0074692_6116 [Micromonospora pallida]|uniref:Uncharacterized protein n=1 Tax=Micromonospora pallida TaxID=145854 RepID=A0A1C6TH00_9ACTN|nr:hypothetical protein [Micromonospora pallida]SCL41050.1 hypothetical protein GA0074692_6116 [Micromonospora pallida]
MAGDVAVDLIRSLIDAMESPSPVMGEDWESFAIILEFGEGFRNASGYAYSPGGVVTPVACSWRDIRSAVDAYMDSHYAPGDALPVKILLQFDRASGRYNATFEETDEGRWKTRPKNYKQIREELRPLFD